MEDTNVKFEVLQQKHCKGLAELYQIVFKKKVPESYFIIKYGLNLESQIQYSIVAIFEGRVIGFHGAIPFVFTNAIVELKLLQTCDFILLEDFRGKGWFQEMYSKTLDLAQKNKFDYLYAFHSDQTYKVCKRLGWQDEVGFSRFQIQSYRYSTTRLFNLLGLNKWRYKRFEALCQPYLTNPSFNDNDFGQSKFVLSNTEKFLQMKQFADRQFIEIDGCSLWLKLDHYLTVGFISFKSTSNPKTMLDFLTNLSRKCYIKDVVIHLLSSSSNAKILREYLNEMPSFKISSLKLNEEANSFSSIYFNFMNMDIF